MFLAAVARAESPIKFKADKYQTDFDSKVTQGWGNVDVNVDGKNIKADQVLLYGKENRLTAEGNVYFQQGDLVVRAKKLEMDLSTGYGSFYDAVLQRGNAFNLEGKVMTRYGDDLYRVESGKLSSCLECPQAWSVAGSLLDMRVEGYVSVHDAMVQVFDVPITYFPFWYFPVKTKRQSGFLLPRMRSSDLGLQLAVPYYWATTRDFDTTFTYQFMSRAGQGVGSEFRYAYSDRSRIYGKGSLVRNLDSRFSTWRFGYSVDQRWQFTPSLTQRLWGEFAGDNRYAIDFDSEFQQVRLPTLSTVPSLSWQSDNLYAFGGIRIQRDNLPRVSSLVTQGDLQQLPELGFFVSNYRLWGPLQASADLEHASWRRTGPAVDPTSNWIREGDRSSLTARLEAPVSFFEIFHWEPRLLMRGDMYNFPSDVGPGGASPAFRGRVYIDNKVSTDIWRVYPVDAGSLRALKHVISPSVRFSYAPNDVLNSHPFFQQAPYPGTSLQAPMFDLFDPYSDAASSSLSFGSITEEQRLRPHALLAVGVDTRVTGRFGETDRSYQQILGASVSQEIDLRGINASVGSVSDRLGPLRLMAFGAYSYWRVQFEAALKWQNRTIDSSTTAGYADGRWAAAFSYKEAGNMDERTKQVALNLSAAGLWGFSVAAYGNYDLLKERYTEYGAGISYGGQCWTASFDIKRLASEDRPRLAPMINVVINEGAMRGH